jgi:hypothetical protein
VQNNELWLPHSKLHSAIAANFPAGSLVFCPPRESKRQTLAPAFRFDVKGEDDEVHAWLFWIQGGPWGSDEKRRTATICREMYGADRRVLGIKANDALTIDIELGLGGVWREDLSWTDGVGAIGSTATGLKIAAADFSNHHLSAVPIDVKTWLYDNDAMRRETYGWYSNWQVRISDGERTCGIIKYEPPPAKA